MRLYVWDFIEGITDNYHDGGGVVMMTARPVQEVWDEYRERLGNEWPDHSRPVDVRTTLPEADYVSEVVPKENKELFRVFPDAGCC